MKNLIYIDFDEFVDALPDLEGQYILRTRQTSDWRLRIIDLSGIKFMFGSEGAGRIYSGEASDESFHIYTLVGRAPPVAVDGVCIEPRTLGWIPPGGAFHISTKSPIRWINVAIDRQLMLDRMSVRQDDTRADLIRHGRPSKFGQSSMTLVHLARRLLQVSLDHPEHLEDPRAASAARSQVLDAVTAADPWPDERRPRQCVNRRRVLDRVLGLLEAVGDETLSTLHLCKAVGCSERTLRNAFHDYFEMSPHQYLAMRRLHAIRYAIREAKPSETITSICSRYGVWDYGRLASAYRSLFGIFPSQAIQQRH